MILLKLDGIDGDCEIKDYKKYIACTSVNWEIEREFSESAKGGTRDVNVGVANIPPITIGKSLDCSSSDLMQHSISGSALTSAELVFLTTSGVDGEGDWFLKYKFDNAIICKWSITGDEDERPSEEISIWYYKIHMHYRSTTNGKDYKDAGTRGWDRVGSKSWTGG